MHNQHVNYVRRGARQGAVLNVDDMGSQLVAVADPTASRQLKELDDAISKPPQEQRQVILLVGLEGMAYEEVAQILMVPVGTVRSRLSRGRSALRQLMGMEEERPPGPATATQKQQYRETGNLRAIQLLLGHTKLESTVRYLGIEVDDALSIAEQVEL
jgi:transposase